MATSAPGPSQGRAPHAEPNGEPQVTHEGYAPPGGTFSLVWLGLAATISGACVMLVEIVGTRVLTPFFGVGLYVWSALLGVTLGALALGYYLGGLVVDRGGRLTISTQLLLAGVWVALVPTLRVPLLMTLDGADVRLGALLAATVLFAPALCLMGMVSTSAVRHSLRGAATSGRSVGRVYALSTLGSLAGTLAAGFWLVPSFAATHVLWGTAAALVATGASGLIISRLPTTRKIAVGGTLLVSLLVASFARDDAAAGSFQILERRQSLYGNLSVVIDHSRASDLKLLRADHSFIGGEWATGEPVFGFVHLLEASRFARPNAKTALLIGLGVGSTARALAEAGIEVDVSELDPEVVDLAKRHFGFTPNGRVLIGDARVLIRNLDQRYDIIIHDTFTGGSTPEHLLSVEVMGRLAELLTEDGLLAVNMVGSARGPLSAAARSVYRTVSSVFPHMRVYQDGPLGEPHDTESQLNNLIFFASRSPIAFPDKLGRFAREPRRKHMFSGMPYWELSPDSLTGGQLITDEHNPIAHLATPVAELFHSQMRKLYPAEFWVR